MIIAKRQGLSHNLIQTSLTSKSWCVELSWHAKLINLVSIFMFRFETTKLSKITMTKKYKMSHNLFQTSLASE